MATKTLTYTYTRLKVRKDIIPTFISWKPGNKIVLTIDTTVNVDRLLSVIKEWFEGLHEIPAE